MKTISVRLDDASADRLAEIVRTRGTSRSDVVRDMINGVDVQPTGVWVATITDVGECVDSVHPNEVAALRKVVDNMYGRARFLRWGQSLDQADREALATEVP